MFQTQYPSSDVCDMIQYIKERGLPNYRSVEKYTESLSIRDTFGDTDQLYLEYVKFQRLDNRVWKKWMSLMTEDRYIFVKDDGTTYCHENYCSGCAYCKLNHNYCYDSCRAARHMGQEICDWCLTKRKRSRQQRVVYGYFCGDDNCSLCDRFFCPYGENGHGCWLDICRICNPDYHQDDEEDEEDEEED